GRRSGEGTNEGGESGPARGSLAPAGTRPKRAAVRVDVLTIFPRMVEAPIAEGIVQRARDKGIVQIQVHDLRDFTEDRHRSVDDAPFGGGPGMVMKAEPFFRAREAIFPPGDSQAVILLSPRGRRFDQATAGRYACLRHLVLLCGRYEGVDERV